MVFHSIPLKKGVKGLIIFVRDKRTSPRVHSAARVSSTLSPPCDAVNTTSATVIISFHTIPLRCTNLESFAVEADIPVGQALNELEQTGHHSV